MTDRWSEVIGLFERIIELPPAERDRYLNDATARDPDLRERVAAMLRSDAEAHPLFDATPDQLALELAAPPAPGLEGTRIGPYVLERELGRGGMGAVYLARRIDVDKRVALKLVAGGLASPDRIDRFLFERRILAQLEHPDIAQLLDAGVADDGTPWLAMEYVNGLRIDEWCDRRALTIEQRLELFERVCLAVACAHRNLVVHRDLKPSNILVTERGEPRLVDFGIAKLLDPADPASLTRTGVQPMTPEYASPEQLRGDPITTATDVYQLGVLLYLLLTGTHPHRLGGRAVHELHRAIAEGDVERPSRVVSRTEPGSTRHRERAAEAERIASARGTVPERLRKQLQGDIDAIALMAIRPEPSRRYASAEQLAEDIRRYLDNHPVLASPDTFRYRARKFILRNRVGVAAAAVVSVSLVAATAGMTWQAGRATSEARNAAAERDRSASEAAKAAQIASFLEDLFASSDPYETPGRDITARELLARGAERLGDQAELAAQPEVRAALLDVLGGVYRSLQQNEEARLLLEQGLALRRQHLEPNHPDIAESLVSLGTLAFYEQKTDEARKLFNEALAIRQSQPVPDSSSIAELLHNISAVHNHNAEMDSAELALRDAIAIRRRLPGDDETRLLAGNLIGLGVILARQNRFGGADSAYQEALQIRRRLLVPGHPEIGGALNVLAGLQLRQNRYVEAEPLAREAVAILRASMGEHTDVAIALTNLGSSLESQARFDEAGAAYRESLEIKRRIFKSDHSSTAISLNNLGRLYMKQERWADAHAMLQQSLDMRMRIWPATAHPDVAAAHYNLGDLHVRRGQFGQAARQFQAALDMYRERPGPSYPLTLRTAIQLADVLHKQGSDARASSLLDWVIEVGAQAEPPARDSAIAQARRLLQEIRPAALD